MTLPDFAPSHTKPPIILVTPDLTMPAQFWPAQPWSEREYVVRANYAEAIREAGGIPLIQPYGRQNFGAVLDLADGVIAGELAVAGGDATEVLEAAEHRLDPPAIPVTPLVEADLALARAGAGNDHADALLVQVNPAITDTTVEADWS